MLRIIKRFKISDNYNIKYIQRQNISKKLRNDKGLIKSNNVINKLHTEENNYLENTNIQNRKLKLKIKTINNDLYGTTFDIGMLCIINIINISTILMLCY